MFATRCGQKQVGGKRGSCRRACHGGGDGPEVFVLEDGEDRKTIRGIVFPPQVDPVSLPAEEAAQGRQPFLRRHRRIQASGLWPAGRVEVITGFGLIESWHMVHAALASGTRG